MPLDREAGRLDIMDCERIGTGCYRIRGQTMSMVMMVPSFTGMVVRERVINLLAINLYGLGPGSTWSSG